ncbi:MAG: D-alanyl-D-alanine carboxypeptidase, partial [Clostridia bacterium]|nr:D-alanyl-D-alanine carboxypeptidase [Clostridia bacterium]
KLTIILCAALAALIIPSFVQFKTASAAEELSLKGAKSAYLMEAGGGEVIFSKNETDRLAIASMTKIMLLNLVFESVESGELKIDEDVTVSENAQSMGGSQVYLEAGSSYKAGELIKSVIISSANDSSVCLAERIFGSESEAVDKMNERAKEWGLENTLFSNVTGLPKPTQYSCAKDVAVMLDHLINHQDYFRYSTIYLDEIAHADGHTTMLTNTNKLVKFYQGCDGGKTGFTSDAGYCLAATAKRGALRVVGVVIGESDSKQRFSDVSSLFDHAFNNYTRKILFDKDEIINEKIKIYRAKDDTVDLKVKNDVYAFTKKGDKSEFTVSIDLIDSVVAPIKCGERVGTLTVYRDGVEYRKEDIVVASDVERLNPFEGYKKIAGRWAI